MMSLLQVVEDDMRMQLGPPPQLTWPKNQGPYVPMYPPPADNGYRPPLLPRPTMMPPDTMTNNYIARPYVAPLRPAPPATLPPLRLDSNERNTKSTVSPMETPAPVFQLQQLDLHREGEVVQISPSLLRKPSFEPLHAYPHIPEYPQHTTPKPIAPRPGSVPTTIKPSPAASKLSRTGSSSPDLLRKQRLLPKALPQPHQPTPPPSEEDRPAHERYPLQRLNERTMWELVSPSTCSAPPPPAPSMGRFSGVGSRPPERAILVQAHTNLKVAIPRHHEGPAPLRIAPAPAKRVDLWEAEVRKTDGSVAKSGSVASRDRKWENSPRKENSEKNGNGKDGKKDGGEEENGKEFGRLGLRSRKRSR